MRLELKSFRAKKSLNEFRSFSIVVVASLVLQNHFEHFFRHCPSSPSFFSFYIFLLPSNDEPINDES